MNRNRFALLAALGIDNVGSGLFLPLPVLFAIQVIGLPVAEAGTVITLGTLAGVLAPPVAGRLVDRLGPRSVVIAAQLIQAAGALVYLVAGNAVTVLLAAMLLAAGQQTFYSSLFALIADTAHGGGPTDHSFARVTQVRAAGFGLGALIVAGLLAGAGPAGYRVAIAGDAVSFGVNALFSLAQDFFLVGMPVYAVTVLRGPTWLPGVQLGLLTAVTAVAGGLAVRATRRLWRTTAMSLGAGLYVLWCAVSAAALLLPVGSRPWWLLGGTVLMGAANLIGARANSLAEAAAPRATRGRHLAAFQYSFTVAGLLAPAVVALFAAASWLPWVLVAAVTALSGAALPWLARHLPDHAVQGAAAAQPSSSAN